MDLEFTTAKNKETRLWHGLCFVVAPTPSGWPRRILKYSTKLGYEDKAKALEVIKQVGQD